jgi:hypothetical protein
VLIELEIAEDLVLTNPLLVTWPCSRQLGHLPVIPPHEIERIGNAILPAPSIPANGGVTPSDPGMNFAPISERNPHLPKTSCALLAK